MYQNVVLGIIEIFSFLHEFVIHCIGRERAYWGRQAVERIYRKTVSPDLICLSFVALSGLAFSTLQIGRVF